MSGVRGKLMTVPSDCLASELGTRVTWLSFWLLARFLVAGA